MGSAKALAVLALVCACKVSVGEPAPFYCHTVGNVAGRECHRDKARCEELDKDHTLGCFPVDHAFCFSKTNVSGDGRDNVCTPTEDECLRWTTIMGENGRKPSGCTRSTRAEVWP
jgi:hypothetical protein